LALQSGWVIVGEFAGVFQRDGAGVNPSAIERLNRSLSGVAKSRDWRGGHVAMMHRPLRQSEVADSIFLPSELRSGTVVATDARLDEPGEVAASLGLGGERRLGDAALVAAACERWGAGAALRLNGSFAFALWDEKERRLTLARDALGTRSLFYVEHPRYILFASTLQSLLALPETPRDLDELVLAQYMTIDIKDNERTVYRHIRRVPPGGMVIFDSKRSRTERYWTIDNIKPVRFRADSDYVEAGRELLDRAVASRLPRTGRLATMLSGGLDSSGVTATVARMLGNQRFSAFNRAPGAPHPYQIMDERALAAEVAARYPNIDLVVIDDDRDSRRGIEPEIDAAEMCVPRIGGLYATWFESLMLAAEDAGTDVLFSGGCGNITLSWEGRPNFGGDLRSGRWASAWEGALCTAKQQGRPVGAFLAGHFLRPLMPRSLMRWRNRRAAGDLVPWATYSLISEDFLDSLDYEQRARESGHDIPFQPRMPFRERRLGTLQGQVNRDLSNAARRKRRLEARDPYADRRMVEFALGIPQEQYWHAGEDRWLARRVLADRLPASLIQERRRGKQFPEWYTILSRHRDGMAAAIERIERSPFASRVVDVPRMKQLLDTWPKDAEAAKDCKQIYGRALYRGIAMGGFLRWHEGGNG
jgi:asparagine synthase (glutamine-hydrolysing)